MLLFIENNIGANRFRYLKTIAYFFFFKTIKYTGTSDEKKITGESGQEPMYGFFPGERTLPMNRIPGYVFLNVILSNLYCVYLRHGFFFTFYFAALFTCRQSYGFSLCVLYAKRSRGHRTCGFTNRLYTPTMYFYYFPVAFCGTAVVLNLIANNNFARSVYSKDARETRYDQIEFITTVATAWRFNRISRF